MAMIGDKVGRLSDVGSDTEKKRLADLRLDEFPIAAADDRKW